MVSRAPPYAACWLFGCLQVETLYLDSRYMRLQKLQAAPIPFSQKLDAILYINSNCRAKSKRQLILRSLQDLIKQRASRLRLPQLWEV